MNPFLAILKSRGVTTPPTENIRVLGIDLGTTTSTVSELLWNAGEPAPLPPHTLDVDQETASGRYTSPMVPSVVAIQNNDPLVGEGAKVLRGRMADHASGLKQGSNIFWECKNIIGLFRTFHKAPVGYRSATDIAGHILKFLLDAACTESVTPIARSVITVPASFRIAQRQDTEKAAAIAGIHITPGDLVDEPVAAFLDYVFSDDRTQLKLDGMPINILLFDFGGGTCDVAIFKVSQEDLGAIAMAPLTVSRYHRLGGGDIDTAIVHRVLIPQLIDQNNLEPFDLSYADKSRCITPAFLSIAESLKIGLCKEITRLTKLGKYSAQTDGSSVFKRNPGISECRLKDGRILKLNSPVLSAVELETILTPFLDQDFLFARETEYQTTCSIFAPLNDALNRAGLSAKDISACLLAGSSSFIPSVQQALESFFSSGCILHHANPDDAKLAISRGAAYHALARHLTGTGVVQPVTADTVFLQTNSGAVQLVPSGTPLPYPGHDEWEATTDLIVPEFPPEKPRHMRLEVITTDQMCLFYASWPVPKDVPAGTQLRFLYSIDENQIIRFRLNTINAPEGEFWEWEIENPLINIEYTSSKREEVEQLEESIRSARVPRDHIPDTLVKIANLTADLGQNERALDLMKTALAAKHGQDPDLLLKMAIVCGDMQDFEKEAKFYHAAADIENWGAPFFNLAISQKRRGHLKPALENIDKAIARERSAPYLVLKALIADTLQDRSLRDACFNDAMQVFGTIHTMSDWKLGWYITAVEYLREGDQIKRAKEELRRRKNRKDIPVDEGRLPDRKAS